MSAIKTNKSDFLRGLGIEHPIVQAPMSGGATTPELVAAACDAGVLGSFGAAYLSPDQIASDIRRIRALTDKPFNVNLFAGGYTSETRVDAAPMLALLAEAHEALGLPAPTLPPWPPNTFNEQLEAVLEARPAVFSFTFGAPDADAMARIKARGIATVGTATTSEEGRRLQESGVTAIAAQGAEAGGHRGTFAGAFESSMVPTMELVQGLLKVVSVPVIASGGLMDGRDIANFLANTFTARLTGEERIILPFPLQNALTRPMRNAAAKQGESGFQSLFCGQGVARARALPAAELVNRLVAEMNSARIASA